MLCKSIIVAFRFDYQSNLNWELHITFQKLIISSSNDIKALLPLIYLLNKEHSQKLRLFQIKKLFSDKLLLRSASATS